MEWSVSDLRIIICEVGKQKLKELIETDVLWRSSMQYFISPTSFLQLFLCVFLVGNFYLNTPVFWQIFIPRALFTTSQAKL